MKLTKNDKELLIEWGHEESDFGQIERASKKTTYTEINQTTSKKVTMKRAIEILGRKSFLSGISRSAFHWTAMREGEDGNTAIYFDSSKYFETI